MTLEHAPSLSETARRVASEFEQRFGRAPTLVAAAPGRVNLIGEHTDYNDGFVLPMAIERYAVVAVAPAGHGDAVVHSATMASEARFSLAGEVVGDPPPWAKYVAGVLSVYSEQGMAAPSFDAVIDSTVPLGGGLSSSAALEVSLATAIEALGGHSVDAAQKALHCQQAEHRAGTPCGIMDQFSSALCEADHLLLLDCRDQTFKHQPFTDPSVSVLITNTNVKHELTGGEYAERREQCEEAARALGVGSLRDASLQQLEAAGLESVLQQRARHVIGEIERTPAAAEALGKGEWERVGELMYQSHAALRDDFEVSCPELDELVEAAREVGLEGGVYGSRMTGGGFGGCTVTLVRTDRAEEAAERIMARYKERTGIDPAAFVTRPAQGARVLSGG